MDNQNAKVIRTEKCSVGLFFLQWFLYIVIGIAMGLLFGAPGLLLSWIPIINIIYAVIVIIFSISYAISVLVSLIAIILNKITLTETGVYGRDGNFKKFDLTFDQIIEVSRVRKTIVIKYVNEKGKTKKSSVGCITNCKDFYDAYNEQLAKAKAAPAEAAAEAEVEA